MYRTLLVLIVACICFTGAPSAQDKPDSDPTVGDKKLSEWKEQLRSKDLATRQAAFSQLRTLRTKAQPVVPLLLEFVEEEDQSLRLAAIQVLNAIGVEAEHAPTVAKMLLSEDSRVLTLGRTLFYRMNAQPNIAYPKATIEPLKKAVSSKESTIRSTAFAALAKMGADAQPILSDALESNDERVQFEVLSAFRLGGGEPYLPQFINALESKAVNVRIAALSAIRALGPKGKPAVEAVRKVLQDADTGVRYQAVTTLAQLRPPTEQFLADLFSLSDDPLLKGVLSQTITALGEDAVPASRKVLREGNTSQQLLAITVVGQLKQRAGDALTDVKDLARSTKDAEVRRASLMALWTIHGASDDLLDRFIEDPNTSLIPLGPSAATQLATRLKKGDTKSKLETLSALRRCGTFAAAANDAIVDSVTDDDAAVRAEAKRTLGMIVVYSSRTVASLYSKADEKAARPLGRVLRSLPTYSLLQSRNVLQPVLQKRAEQARDWVVRLDAAHMFYVLSGRGEHLHSAVAEAMKSDDPEIRRVAVESVAPLIPPQTAINLPAEQKKQLAEQRNQLAEQARTVLPQALKDNDLGVRLAAVEGMLTNSHISASSTQRATFVEPLVAGLKSSDDDLRLRALQGVNALGEDATSAVGAISPLIESKNNEVKQWAIFVVGKLKPEAAIAELTRALADSDAEVRQYAIQALAVVGAKAKQAVPALTKALDDSDLNVRLSAADALGNIGPDAANAVPKLVALFETASLVVPSDPFGRQPFPGGTVRPEIRQLTVVGAFDYLPPPREHGKPFAVLATALGKIGPNAKSAIPVLEKRIAVNPQLTFAVLGQLGESTLPVVTKALASNDREIRLAALDALGQRGSVPEKALDKIIDLTQSKNTDFAQQALFALIQLGKNATRAKKTLTRLVSDETSDAQTKRLAERALQTIEDKDKSKTPPMGEVPEAYRPTVAKGLTWLVARQQSDGSWSESGGQYPVAMTAFSGLALMAEGSTPTKGKYAKQIRKASEWLLQQCEPSGLIAAPDPRMRSRYIFGHGYAMLFLACLYDRTEDAAFKRRVGSVLNRAVRFSALAQTKLGGYGYVSAKEGNDYNEGAATVVALRGLRAAREVHIPVPQIVWDKGRSYLDKSTTADGGVIYSLATGGAGSGRPAITAGAIVALAGPGENDDALVKRWIRYCGRHVSLPQSFRTGHDEFTHFAYAQYAYSLGEKPRAEGELTWTAYRDQQFAQLKSRQNADGSFTGTPGPVYATSVYLTILQLDKSALPVFAGRKTPASP